MNLHGTKPQSGTLLLTRQEVGKLLNLEECMDAVEQGFLQYAQGKALLPGVVDIDAGDGAFHIKSAFVTANRSYAAVKVNGNFPQNRIKHQLPTIQGVILLHDGDTGFPLAIMDSIEITIKRTGAATVLAAKYLARPDSSVVTICGCGNQGRISLEGLKRLLPIENAFVYDIDEAAARRFAEEMTTILGIPVTRSASLPDATKRSDIIVTCTPSRKPFLGKDDVKAGTFIAAVGADAHDKQELHSDLLRSSKIVADIVEQCLTIGELHHAVNDGVVTRADVHAEIGEIIAGSKKGRTSNDEIIVFDSTGTALQDVAAAVVVFEKVTGTGIGTYVTLA